MNYINKELRTEAVLNGLCMQWQSEWMEDKSQDELIEMYKRGIDFCIKHDYPSIDWIEKNFDKEILNRNGIFVNDDIFNMNMRNGVFVLNGDCCGLMEFSGRNVSTVYVRGTSEININCSEDSIVHIVLYDKSCAYVKQSDNSKVLCIRKSKKSSVNSYGDVKVVNRC